MILVTGATGQLGKLVIDALLVKIPSAQIAGLVRDKSKATDLISKGINIIEGEYHDYESLVQAFSGIDKVLLISAHAFTDRVTQHTNVIDAAKEAGVKHVFYTGIQRSNNYILPEVTESDLKTEQHLKESGLDYTIISNNSYLDGISFLLGSDVLENGIKLPAGEEKAAFITRDDIAAATAELLIGEGHKNKEYVLSGSEAYSFKEIAALLSELSGKTISYNDVTPEEFTQQRVELGIPLPFVLFLAEWAAAIKSGMLAKNHKTVEQLTGKKSLSMNAYLKAAYFPENQL